MFDRIRTLYTNYKTKQYMLDLEAFAIQHGKTLPEIKAIFKRVDITPYVPKITPQNPAT